MLTFHIITVFPKALTSYLTVSLLGRAIRKRLVKVNLVPLHRFAKGKHRSVDDSPYGGGPGMVLRVAPIYRAVQSVRGRFRKRQRSRVILFSTRGKVFDQATARRFATYDALILICGRYEGVDERVAEHIADEEISMGSYVLAGGELPALTVVEAVARHVPGVLGKRESLEEVKGSYPVYTRPEVFTPGRVGRAKVQRRHRWRVPAMLISGNHRNIERWRERHR